MVVCVYAERDAVGVRVDVGISQNQEMTLPFLEPWFKELVPALLIAICCPADIEKADQDEGFEIEPFVDFREVVTRYFPRHFSCRDRRAAVEARKLMVMNCEYVV